MFRLSILFASSLLFAAPAFSQELPKKIRGYSVHRETVTVQISSDAASSSRSDAVLNVGDPVVTAVGLSGVGLQLPANVTASRQSGKVDFLTFHNFKVNGVAVNIDEYSHSFSFRKNELVKLPEPVEIFLPTNQILKAAWREMSQTQKEWTVTGRIFVFGKFRKFGFNHRRVVPVDITIQIANPLLTADSR